MDEIKDIQVQGAIVRKVKVMGMLSIFLTTLVVFIVASSKEDRQHRNKQRRVACPFYKHIIQSNNTNLHHQICMSRVAFFCLAKILRKKGKIINTVNIKLEEQLVMFLHTLGHNLRNRKIGHKFGLSGEIVSRHFHKVLRAITTLHKDYLLPLAPTTPLEIVGKSHFDPFFKLNILLSSILVMHI